MCKRKFLGIIPYYIHNWSSWVIYDVEKVEEIPNLFKEGSTYERHHTETRERRKCVNCGKTQDQVFEIDF